MKVIHTFSSKEIIWKELLYSQTLSALLAKKHYGNIHFFGSEKSVKQVKEAGLRYDTYDDLTITDDDSTTFSIPKLKVFKSMNEEFLHIDTDTFIFDKIDFTKNKSPFVFSHPDILIDKLEGNLRESLNNLFTHTRSFNKSDTKVFYDLNNTYLRLFYKLQHKLPDNIIKAFDAGSIPNMNIVHVKDIDAFKYACEKTLEHYREAKYEIDSEEFGPCYIEQFILHLNLRAINDKYREASNENEHVYFSDLPFKPGEQRNLVPEVDGILYPLTFSSISKCKCCDSSKFKDYSIKSRQDFKNYLDFDFGGFYHATFMKWYEHYQALIINKIVTEFGEEHVVNIHRYFKNEYKNYDLPLISGGEKFYEELTGSTIFTNLKEE